MKNVNNSRIFHNFLQKNCGSCQNIDSEGSFMKRNGCEKWKATNSVIFWDFFFKNPRTCLRGNPEKQNEKPWELWTPGIQDIHDMLLWSGHQDIYTSVTRKKFITSTLVNPRGDDEYHQRYWFIRSNVFPCRMKVWSYGYSSCTNQRHEHDIVDKPDTKIVNNIQQWKLWQRTAK